MISPIEPFVLPKEMPDFKGKDPKVNKYADITKEKAEKAISHILNGQINAEDTQTLVRFVRMMAHDVPWLKKNRDISMQVMRALSICYLQADDRTTHEKIKQMVRDKGGILSAYTLPDLNIQLTEQVNGQKKVKKEIPYSALFLACLSPVFDRMMRGKFQEASKLREAYKSRAELPNIPIQELPIIFERFKDILIGRNISTLKNLSPEMQGDLVRYCDQNDALSALLDVDEAFVFRNIVPEIVHRVCEHSIEKEARSAHKAKRAPLSEDQMQKRLEARFLKHTGPENAAVMFEFAREKKWARLSQQALYFLMGDLEMEEAVLGLQRQEVKLGDYTLKGEEVKNACINWFLSAFATSGQAPINPGASKEKKGLLSRALSVVQSKPKDNTVIPSLELHLRNTVLPALKSLCFPALRELNKEQLAWLLKELNSALVEIDLSDCKLADFRLLNRFTELRILKLARNESLTHLNDIVECKKLEELDLSGCTRLTSIDLSRFPSLKHVNLSNCVALLPDMVMGLDRCRTLASVHVDPRLQAKFASQRFAP